MNISHLNSNPYEEFVETISLLFEPAPPLAQALYSQRPFLSFHSLIEQAVIVINNSSASDKLLIINAHPRIGAAANTLSDQSKIEQQCSQTKLKDPEEAKILSELAYLNKEYE